jgi:cellulase/cellobiase CelA1
MPKVWCCGAGESDGSSGAVDTGGSGKKVDGNCSPNDPLLDAWPGAPLAGHWFHDAFVMLVKNAVPPLPGGSDAETTDTDLRAMDTPINPFVGSKFYVNPDYAAEVLDSAKKTSDPTLKAKMSAVSQYSTAIWLDTLGAIPGGGSNSE